MSGSRRRTLEVRDLTVRYGGVTAVDDVSLRRAARAGSLGLIGPNGAGKTSVIDAVTGFTRVDGQRSTLDGQSSSSALSAAKRARGRAQPLVPVARAVRGLHRARQPARRVRPARPHRRTSATSSTRSRRRCPARSSPRSSEFELEDDLLRQVQDLPYGQRRLLAIARAVATQPSVLLLDEPAAGLGDVETAELAHLVRRLADDWGIAVLLVEHDMNFVMSVCDDIVVLDFGRQIAEGTPEAIRRNPAVVAAYLGESDDDAEVGTRTGSGRQEVIADASVERPACVGRRTARAGDRGALDLRRLRPAGRHPRRRPRGRGRARWSPCSARTAPARRRRCSPSPASCRCWPGEV